MARQSKVAEQADSIKNHVRSDSDERVEFISSGSTMVNLAASGKGKRGGWARSRIGNIVGDGSSGKTLLALEACFWVHQNMLGATSSLFPTVNNVRIRYNNVANVMDFPLKEMYGEEFIKAIDWHRTGTIEDFGRDYAREVMALKPGNFLLYVVDDWDTLASEAGKERFIKAAEKDKPEDGAYGTEKAKYGSVSFFNNIADLMTGKDSTLLIISQVRQKINVTFGKKTYRAGGEVLNFATHQVAWLAEVQKLKRMFRGEERVYGICSRARFERNKTAKPFREAEFTILYDHGLDDISSMLDWYYGPKAEKIEFDGEKLSRVELIKYIEDNELEDILIEMVEKEWNEIENAMKPQRKPRF